MSSLDTFGKDIPSFNIKGETKISTVCGGVLTAIIWICTISYASVKFAKLITHANPQITEVIEKNYYKGEDSVDLSAINFRMAFTVESYIDKQMKKDSRYIKWFIRQKSIVGGEDVENILEFHPCTEEDYAQFYPIETRQESLLNKIKNDPLRGFFCLNWATDKLTIFGDENGLNYQRLEFATYPCNYVHVEYGYKDDFVADECIPDLE